MIFTHMFSIPGFQTSHYACAYIYKNSMDRLITNTDVAKNVNIVLVKMPKTKNKDGKFEHTDILISMNFKLANDTIIEMDVDSFLESFPKRYTSIDCRMTSKIRELESRYIDSKFSGTTTTSDTDIVMNAVHVLIDSKFNNNGPVSKQLFDSFMRETLFFMHNEMNGVRIQLQSNSNPFILITSVVFPKIYLADEIKNMMKPKNDLYTKISGHVKSALMRLQYLELVPNIYPCKISWNVCGAFIPTENKDILVNTLHKGADKKNFLVHEIYVSEQSL